MKAAESSRCRPCAGLWTTEQDAELRRLHPTNTQDELAAALGRTKAAVRTRCVYLGLNGKVRPWQDADVAKLIQAYEDAGGKPLDLKALASAFGRHHANVSRKARGLGLTDKYRPRVEERKIRWPKYSTQVELRAAQSETAKAWIREKGHPRGALGIRHSAETRAVLSRRGREAWANPLSGHNTDEARQRRSDLLFQRMAEGKMLSGREAYSRCASGRRADLNDRFFRSAWEANYARFLNFLMGRGEIVSWDYECRTFWFEKIKRGTRSYTPDFLVVFPDGHHEWHEVKGWMDQPSRTRLDRMARYYPDETLKVIGEDWFKSVNRSGLSGAIPNWEKPGRKGR